MSAPIELRQRFRKFTVDDARSGLQPIKLQPRPGVTDVFVAVGMQYRVQRKVLTNGSKAYEWGPWLDARISLEGYDVEDERSLTQDQEEPAAPA